MQEKRFITKNVILIVIILVIIAIVSVSLIIKSNHNKVNEGEINSVSTSTENKSNEDYADIVEFLTADGIYISEESMQGAGHSNGYYFDKEGKLSYTRGEYPPTQEKDIITQRGIWSIKDGKLIIDIQEEEIAIGGRKVNDPIDGEHLEDYKKEVVTVNEKIEYEIKDLLLNKEKEKDKDLILNKNNSKYYLKLDKTNFYQLGAEDYFLNKIKDIALNGYNK